MTLFFGPSDKHNETGNIMEKRRIFMAIVLATAAVGLAALQPSATVAVQTLAKSSSSWEQSALPEYPRGQPEITVLRITIPPHAELPMHQHPVINAGALIKGQLTVETGSGKKLQLKTGDALIEVVDQWHRGVNDGDEPAEIVVFYAGIAGEAITIKQQ